MSISVIFGGIGGGISLSGSVISGTVHVSMSTVIGSSPVYTVHISIAIPTLTLILHQYFTQNFSVIIILVP